MGLLAGDLGATKIRLGIFEPGETLPEPIAEGQFSSDPSSSLEAVVKQFLESGDFKVTAACFGVAGPVVGGRAKITNLPWVIGENELSRDLGIPRVKLINDLEATAWSIPSLGTGDAVVLHEGKPAEGGNIAVIAPGTGLGEAYLTWDGRRYHAYASEGGHADFAPQSPLEMELLQDFQKQFGHVSYERVCAGQAVPFVYRFLKDRGCAEEPAWLSRRLREAGDATPVIINAAIDKERMCELARKTLELFIAVLGAEASNLAVKILATGGVYLAGGVALHVLPALNEGGFMEAFLRKGRMSGLVDRMPVYVITNPGVALIGAACCGLPFI
ncbi:MAG: glucokinase [Deltaproteobacteria bacterium]|nr:glucokinase [Deltaproteobacteria bacterium]